MAKFKFHQVAAVLVLIGFALWMGTGTFSSVGSASAQGEAGHAAEQPKPAPANSAEPAKAKPRTVMVITPPRVSHARAIRISGQTMPDKRATIAARAAGIIKTLDVKEGDHVEAGDVILELDTEDKPAFVEMATQVVKQREAELVAAQRLTKSGASAKLQLDMAISALATAKSQLEAAQADLARYRLIAPFSGTVDRVEVELGSSIAQGAEVATILTLNPVLVKGEISERDLGHIKIGDVGEAVLVNGEKVAGTVRYISREATATTRTFRVEVAIENKDDRIPAGMTAEITLRTAPSEAVLLPRSVVTLSNKGDIGIRTVDKDNKIVFVPIDLLDDLPRGLALGGVPADARIVIAGQDLVNDGDVVDPIPATEEILKKLADATAGTN